MKNNENKSNQNQDSTEMPKYQCHNIVWALKIEKIRLADKDLGAEITPELGEVYAPFIVDNEYLQKHNPQEGGYYVVYKGGYKSYYSAEAFKAYTRILRPTSKDDDVPEEEIEIIERHIASAADCYMGNITPEENTLTTISNNLYSELFSWRDNQKIRPRNKPVAFTLIEVLKDLKYGRTGEDQTFLQECIDKLEINEKDLSLKTEAEKLIESLTIDGSREPIEEVLSNAIKENYDKIKGDLKPPLQEKKPKAFKKYNMKTIIT